MKGRASSEFPLAMMLMASFIKAWGLAFVNLRALATMWDSGGAAGVRRRPLRLGA
jgi:hypothetical protein